MKRLRVLALLAFASCVDPVHDEKIAAEGPEAPGVPEGPLHRPGSTCTTCHGARGPGEPELSIGGTVYRAWDSTEAANGAVVTVTDAHGKEKVMTANEAGNFYATKAEFDPVYPLGVKVTFDGKTEEMKTKIRRDGGCGTCHRSVGDRSHAAQIYVPGGGPP